MSEGQAPYGGASKVKSILDGRKNRLVKADKVVLINPHDKWAQEDHVYPGLVYTVELVSQWSIIVSGHDALGQYFIEAQSFEKYTNDWDV